MNCIKGSIVGFEHGKVGCTCGQLFDNPVELNKHWDPNFVDPEGPINYEELCKAARLYDSLLSVVDGDKPIVIDQWDASTILAMTGGGYFRAVEDLHSKGSW